MNAEAALSHLYILEGTTPKKPSTIAEWDSWIAHAARTIRETRLVDPSGRIDVVTVFTAVDRSELIETGKPVLFETAVYGHFCDGIQARYFTYGQAVDGHNDIVAALIRDGARTTSDFFAKEVAMKTNMPKIQYDMSDMSDLTRSRK